MLKIRVHIQAAPNFRIIGPAHVTLVRYAAPLEVYAYLSKPGALLKYLQAQVIATFSCKPNVYKSGRQSKLQLLILLQSTYHA